MDKRHIKTSRPVAKLKEGRTDWYRIDNKTSDTPKVYIYDEIGYFGVTAQDLVKELADIKADKIDVHLSSPGGDVFDGIAIFNALRNHPAEVTTYVDSLAASIASVIMQSGSRRVVVRNSQVMIHEASGLCIGNATDMAEMTSLLDKASDNIASVYSDRAGGSTEDWRTVMKAETWYSAEEAVQAGLADEVMDPNGTPPKNSWDLSVFNYSGREEAPAPVIAPEEEFDVELFVTTLKGAFSA